MGGNINVQVCLGCIPVAGRSHALVANKYTLFIAIILRGLNTAHILLGAIGTF